MSANIIKKISEVFTKKDDCEATNVRLPHPYYNAEEPQEIINTQPRLKISLDAQILSETNAADVEATKVAQLHIVQDKIKERWILRVVSGVDQGRQFLVVTPEIKIGRKTENHVCLKDPKVSRFHAVLRFEGSCVKIMDLDSTNGTSVNGQKIESDQMLSSGDQIRVGETQIQINAEPC